MKKFSHHGLLLSGGFDPLHVGHVRMIIAAKNLNGEVTVALNSDAWLERKKGYAFMPWYERAEILRALHVRVVAVDDTDGTVCEALDRLRPKFFGNGGDRASADPREHAVCLRLNIEELFGLGGKKVQSSSAIVSNSRRALQFSNSYEPDNPIQKSWDVLNAGCLCGHFETCSNCDGSKEQTRLATADLAYRQGYQLWMRSDQPNVRSPLNYSYYFKNMRHVP